MKRLVCFTFALIFFLFASNTKAAGTAWYVDSAAAGSGNGTSWQNAWNNPGSVNFGLMNAGDVLYISGGSSSKTYNGTLNIPAGTNGVTVTKGTVIGHSGEVIFEGQGSGSGIKINATASPVKNILISNLTFKAYAQAISADGGGSGGLQGLVIDNVRILDFKRAGIFIDGYGNESGNKNIVVKNSYLDDDNTFTGQSDGIYAQVLTDFTADHNTIILDNNYTVVPDVHSDNIQTYYVKNVTYSGNTLIQRHDKTLGVQMLFTEEASTLEGNGVHTVVNNVLIRDCPFAQDSAIRIKAGKGTVFTAKVIGNTYFGRAGRMLNSSVPSVIKNNIFYSLGAGDIAQSSSDVSNNIISTSGGSNPGFVNASFPNPDLHLQSGSAAINTGAALGAAYNSDKDGNLRPQGAGWDIGAYEYGGSGPIVTAQPTASPSGKTGDVDGNGRVDIIDIGIIIDNYAKSPIPNPKADVNRDGKVDIVDIGIVLDNYGK